MVPENLNSYLQESTTSPYPEPDISSPLRSNSVHFSLILLYSILTLPYIHSHALLKFSFLPVSLPLL
jgi:hypothetical protein